MTPQENADYQRGYAAGKRRGASDVETHFRVQEKQERIFMQSLEMTLKHCSGWQIGGKTINDAEGYCKLAKIFADHAIKAISS